MGRVKEKKQQKDVRRKLSLGQQHLHFRRHKEDVCWHQLALHLGVWFLYHQVLIC